MGERLNLVTGATGFTGSYVLRELLDDGQKVIGTDLPSEIEKAHDSEVFPNIGLDLDHPNLELIPSNLLEPESLEPLFDHPVTHLFHPASLYDYSADLEILRKVNVEGTENLLSLALEADLERFIHWSTCGVFGKPHTAAEGAEKNNLPFDEQSSSPKNTPPDAEGPEGTHLVNDYSVSKWEQEKLVWQAYREEDLPLTVVRPAPIYGPGSSYGHGGIILGVAQGHVPVIPSDAKNYITTSVHVEDIAGFACYIADRDEGLGEDYNVVDNSIISYHEFLHYIALLCGRRMRDIPLISNGIVQSIMKFTLSVWQTLEKNFGIARPRVFESQSINYMVSSYWLSNRKTLEAGYEYNYPDVKEGLKDTVAWFRKMGWLNDSSKVFVVSPGGSKPADDEKSPDEINLPGVTDTKNENRTANDGVSENGRKPTEEHEESGSTS